jgi:hypothetical protein
MPGFPKFVAKFVIGAAALSVAGACAAQAATADLHTMLVGLPDGSVAQVQYRCSASAHRHPAGCGRS